MLLIPLAIRKLGLRRVMILGLLSLLIRYLSFYLGSVLNQPWLYYVGILVHGLIFGFFYVGGQIYIDKKAPDELKAQAQGFIFLTTFGLGLLTGNLINGEILRLFTNTTSGTRIYDWNWIWGLTSIFSTVLLFGFILIFKNEKAETTQ